MNCGLFVQYTYEFGCMLFRCSFVKLTVHKFLLFFVCLTLDVKSCIFHYTFTITVETSWQGIIQNSQLLKPDNTSVAAF